MSVARIQFPKDKDALWNAVEDAVSRGRTYRNPLSIEWTINYWYLQGVRKFNILSFKTGQVRMTFESPEGQLQFRYEDVLDKYQKELGRLLRLDTLPKSLPKGLGIDSHRKASISQVILDHLAADAMPEKIKLELFEGLLQYGTMGIGAWVEPDGTTNGVQTTLESIPPWQLLPLPSRPTRSAETTGIMRHRYVPLKWLQSKRPDWDFPNEDQYEKMRIHWVAPGEKKADEDDVDEYGSYNAPHDRGMDAGIEPNRRKKGSEMDEPYIELVETWIPDENGQLDRYIATSYMHVFSDISYEEELPNDKPFMPIGIARYNHTGGFWGRSYCGPLIPLNIEAEKMIQNLSKNVQDLDMFGFLLLPSTYGIKKEHLKSTNRPRALFYEPDYTADKLETKQFQPVNTGDFPGRTVALFNQITDRLSRGSPLDTGNAPGRVDSASGLGLLYETSSIGTIPVGVSVAEAFSCVYKQMLFRAKDILADTQVIKMSAIDDQIAGIVLDPKSGEMAVGDKNPIPHPNEVILTIREREPTSKEARKQEVIGLVQMQLMSPEDFWWTNFEEDLGFPSGLSQRKLVSSIRSCMYRNILQWNDGQSPGGVVVSAHDDHVIHMRVLEAFMQRPIFELGSKEVRESFEARLRYHEAALGGFPEGMPRPDEAAEMAQAGVPWASAGGGGPQSLPPTLAGAMEQAGQAPM